jgi:hypothetical protein
VLQKRDYFTGMDGMGTYFSDLHDYRLMFKFLDIDDEVNSHGLLVN